MTKPIFIHGLFRTSSTYFFDKFREADGYWCYYEPFHHIISKLSKNNIDIWRHSVATSKKMNHPSLSRPHFYEYSNAFIGNQVGFFDKSLSYDRFHISESCEPEKKYIDHLIKSTPEDLIPVLHFNRSTFRLQSLVELYPKSKHIYLLRNPREQFQSYVSSGPDFLALNLQIANRLSVNGFSPPIAPMFFTSPDIDSEILFYLFRVPFYSLIDHYKLFLYLWINSYRNAIDSGCKIIDINKFTDSDLREIFDSGLAKQINFSDYSVNNRKMFCLKKNEIIDVECQFIDSIIGDELTLYISELLPNHKVVFSKKLRLTYYFILIVSIIYRILYWTKNNFFRLFLKLWKCNS